jgi:serine/threonine-protein kinase
VDGVYTVDREIGRGGAAIVYLAHDIQGTAVALKVLRPELAASVTAERFLREIKLVRALDHPRIARLIDAGEKDWLVYFVMPYVEGPTLKVVLDDHRRLPPEDVIRIADELLEALAHAHARGIVHRDVKPDNIMLTAAGATLVDFGIARAVAVSANDRVTRSGFTVGTSTYMSPEQIEALPDIDARADLYGLGCVLYECIAGRPPFLSLRESKVLEMHRLADPPSLLDARPETPPGLHRAIMRALEKDRAKRWPDAEAMRAAIRE